MKKKLVGLMVVMALALGTSWIAYANKCDGHGKKHHACDKHKGGDHHDYCSKHSKCDKRKSSSCSKKNCILKERKECVCFYLKKSEELGLTEDQISKLKKLDKEAAVIRIRTKAEVKVLKLDIHELLDAEKPNQDDINAKIDKMSELKSKMKKACINASLRAREILTKEQYQLSKKLPKTCELPPEKKCDKAGK